MSVDKKAKIKNGISGPDKICIIEPFEVLKIVEHETPVYSPTYTPTYNPTYTPTYVPTYSPTYVPTYSPTYTPTYTPTQDGENDDRSNWLWAFLKKIWRWLTETFYSI